MPNISKNKDVNIEVKYLTRVEGHGNIIARVKDGQLVECRFEVVESPRFFESMLVGRSIFEAQHITSRICGICACGHSLASIKAAEAAMGIKPSAQTVMLRELLLYGETLDSHLLHFYILIAPDLLGAKSVFPLVSTHRPVIEMALRLKKTSDTMCEILAGRHTHPISYVVGGLTKLPTEENLTKILKGLTEACKDFEASVEIFKTLKFPDFERPTQYSSLVSKDDYAFLDGNICVSSVKEELDPQNYLEWVKEFNREYSMAKFTTIHDQPYAVGALARFNNSSKLLHPKAKKVATELGLKAPCVNPYLNTVAQIVEWEHCLEKSIEIVEQLLRNGVNKEASQVTSWPTEKNFKVKPGCGVGAVEVPRGVLYHDYTVDEDGIITKANCIIPTGQNLFNLESDLKKIVPELVEKYTDEEIQLRLEMLARAYDPCISCATHLMKVEFI